VRPTRFIPRTSSDAVGLGPCGELVGDAGRGMARRIEIATDAVDLVVTDCGGLTAPAHKRASMDAEYRARGRRRRYRAEGHARGGGGCQRRRL